MATAGNVVFLGAMAFNCRNRRKALGRRPRRQLRNSDYLHAGRQAIRVVVRKSGPEQPHVHLRSGREPTHPRNETSTHQTVNSITVRIPRAPCESAGFSFAINVSLHALTLVIYLITFNGYGTHLAGDERGKLRPRPKRRAPLHSPECRPGTLSPFTDEAEALLAGDRETSASPSRKPSSKFALAGIGVSMPFTSEPHTCTG